MVPLFVFYIHTVAAATSFTRRWQDGGWGEGLLGVAFIALIFSVGWSITTVIAHAVMEQQGFGRWFDRDAFALALLTVIEATVFFVQTRRKRRKNLAAAGGQ